MGNICHKGGIFVLLISMATINVAIPGTGQLENDNLTQ